MGLCATKDNELSEQRAKNKELEVELKEEKRRLEREAKLLLLGTGESGKSTIAKQMKIIHLEGFSPDELMNYRPIVHNNALSVVRTLVQANSRLGIGVEPQNEKLAEEFGKLNPLKVELTPELGADIATFWKDEGIQKALLRSNEYQLPDVAEYVMEEIERISADDYVPNEADVLRCRARTTGIIETVFNVDELTFRMVDVGGQRSERKKWIHCFQDVTALIFCVALNEYDMKLFEDETVNRMHESIELFDEIVNARWFQNASIILFLNKSDLFQKKIVERDMTSCFPDYTGGKDFLNATAFISNKFTALDRHEDRQVYVHTTCATDTENIRFIFTAVSDAILSSNLKNSGF
jgi:guanine nucleotide-binding protein G(i) subunit alpha